MAIGWRGGRRPAKLRLLCNAIDENKTTLFFALLDIQKNRAQVIVEPCCVRVTHSANFVDDGIVHGIESRSSSGVQMMGAFKPRAALSTHSGVPPSGAERTDQSFRRALDRKCVWCAMRSRRHRRRSSWCPFAQQSNDAKMRASCRVDLSRCRENSYLFNPATFLKKLRSLLLERQFRPLERSVALTVTLIHLRAGL